MESILFFAKQRREEEERILKLLQAQNKEGKLGEDSTGSRRALSPIQQLGLLGDDSSRGQIEGLVEGLAQVNALTTTISETINQGINGGIDTLFNALANNQDPFAALALSAKRLVFELGAAVVKALILQTIANAIAPGSGGAGRAFASFGSGLLKGTVRGDQLRLLTFLRGG